MMRAAGQDRSRKRLGILVIAAAILALLVLATRVDISGIALPLPNTAETLEIELADRMGEAKIFLKQERRDAARREKLERLADPFWRSGHRSAQARVQSEFEQLSRRAHVMIQTLGSPHIRDYSDTIEEVELTVRIRASMKEIARLLEEVEKADPPFFWTLCTIRPNDPRDPSGVVLSGKVSVLMLKAEASRLLAGKTTGGDA